MQLTDVLILVPLLQSAVSNETQNHDKLYISELQGPRQTEKRKNIIPRGEREEKSWKVTETAR